MPVRLTWDGRDDSPLEPLGALVDEGELAVGGALALEGQVAPRPVAADLLEHARARAETEPRGTWLDADNVRAMRALLASREGSFGLAYLDPPYLSNADYVHEGTGARAYGDRWADRGSYLDMLWPCLRLVHRLLAPWGTIWVQVDHRASGLVQPLLDELFGPDRLRNVVAWRRAPPLGRQVQSHQFPRNLDLLFCYAKGPGARWNPQHTRAPFDRKAARRDEQGRWFTTAPRGDYTDASVARLEAEGRIHRTAAGKVYVKYFLEEAPDGALFKPRAVDAVWDDVAPLRHARPKERTGYPTQKPEPLLQRILESTTDPGDAVLDPFAGSGTTGVVAARLGRPFVLIDQSPVARSTAAARFGAVGVRVACLRLA